MKIIRWFLSHFFLILLIVVVIYGYMFWGNLAGEKTPAGKALAYLSSQFVEVKDFVEAVKAKQAQLSTQQAPADLQAAEKPLDQAENNLNAQSVAAVPEADKTVAVARKITQQPVTISYSHNQMRVKQNSIGQIESQAEVSAARTSAEPAIQVALVKQPEIETTPEPAPAPTPDPVPEPSPAPEPAPKPAPDQAEAASVETAPVEKEATLQRVTAIAKPANTFVSPQLEQQLNNVDKNGKVINPAVKGDAIRASWVTARKSFYQRKYALSEQSYRNVINHTTDNFDAYGELGNVYFNQGKNIEAAAAYFEAASILVRKGQIGRARSLMGLLRHLDDSKAADLQKLIDSAVS